MAAQEKLLKGLFISPEVTKYSEIQTSEFNPDEESKYLNQLAKLLNEIPELFDIFLEPSKRSYILQEIKKELLKKGPLDSNDPLSTEDSDMYEKLIDRENSERLLTKLESLLKEADVYSEDGSTGIPHGTVDHRSQQIKAALSKGRLATRIPPRRGLRSPASRASQSLPPRTQSGGFRKTNKRQNKGRKRVSKRKSKK